MTEKKEIIDYYGRVLKRLKEKLEWYEIEIKECEKMIEYHRGYVLYENKKED